MEAMRLCDYAMHQRFQSLLTLTRRTSSTLALAQVNITGRTAHIAGKTCLPPQGMQARLRMRWTPTKEWCCFQKLRQRGCGQKGGTLRQTIGTTIIQRQSLLVDT